MSTSTGPDAALLQTIAELRHDVNRMIDEQLTRVRALDEKQAASAPPERRYSAPQPAPAPAPRPPRPQAAVRARDVIEEPLPPPPSDDSAQRPARAQAAVRGREVIGEALPPPPSDDPSQRLDALARHLDGRLRRSSGRARAASGDAAERPPRELNGSHGSASEATS